LPPTPAVDPLPAGNGEPTQAGAAHRPGDALQELQRIAQQLFITVKTVEMHLTRTYRKLDLTSRGGLSGALAA